MPIVDSKTGRVRVSYTGEELADMANLMRGYNLISLRAAGSGHSGGTLSIMDITAALYLHVARHDPENPSWEERDRIIWSTGHKAPSLYIGLGMARFFDVEEVVKLRKLWSPFQGHPHWPKLEGVEASTGSLGQGLSIAVGIALAGKLDSKDFRVYSLNGDGELQEGQIWEAAMEAGNFKLDNLCCIVDKNRLQIDGWVKDVMDIDPLADKFRAFKWHVVEIDGHDMGDILSGFEEAGRTRGKPTVIIAHTTKGKGVSFMEDIAGWHGKAPSPEEMAQGLSELGLKERLNVERLLKKAEDYQKGVDERLKGKIPRFKRDYFWNRQENMKVEMNPTRKGFGKVLENYGDDERVVCLGADISGSITISDFYARHPERKRRFLSVGIAEQSGTGVAAGLAKEGKLPVFGTYGVFASGRNLDQLRTTVCYGNFNVFIAGAHGGVSVGPDGATHQALEEIFNLGALPNMTVVVPCDYIETFKASKYLLFEHVGPKYLRFAREATPVVTKEDTPFIFNRANIYRYRGERPGFIDAFDLYTAEEYGDEGEEVSIIACGPEVPEAMRAAWILKEDYGIETRVINLHTVKPMDRETILKAARETEIIVTAEEHQVGGFGNQVASAIITESSLKGRVPLFGMIGVKDRFGESGAPWELIMEFELGAEFIARKVLDLYLGCEGSKTQSLI